MCKNWSLDHSPFQHMSNPIALSPNFLGNQTEPQLEVLVMLIIVVMNVGLLLKRCDGDAIPQASRKHFREDLALVSRVSAANGHAHSFLGLFCTARKACFHPYRF